MSSFMFVIYRLMISCSSILKSSSFAMPLRLCALLLLPMTADRDDDADDAADDEDAAAALSVTDDDDEDEDDDEDDDVFLGITMLRMTRTAPEASPTYSQPIASSSHSEVTAHR